MCGGGLLWPMHAWACMHAWVYAGRRGVLFWANKAAYASVFILLGGWVIFRIVLPNLGLYQLTGDVTMPQL